MKAGVGVVHTIVKFALRAFNYTIIIIKNGKNTLDLVRKVHEKNRHHETHYSTELIDVEMNQGCF